MQLREAVLVSNLLGNSRTLCNVQSKPDSGMVLQKIMISLESQILYVQFFRVRRLA